MVKKHPLKVGQRVWIETTAMFFRSEGERDIDEHEIVEANNSSAYSVRVDYLDEYNKDVKKYSSLRRRIAQRSHIVKSDGFGDRYTLWLSKESFEANVKYNEDLSVHRKKAHEIVDGMTLAGLENLINKFE